MGNLVLIEFCSNIEGDRKPSQNGISKIVFVFSVAEVCFTVPYKVEIVLSL